MFHTEMQDGWGLATDGKILFGSDGTSTLYHMNPKTFKGLHYAEISVFLVCIIQDAYSIFYGNTCLIA